MPLTLNPKSIGFDNVEDYCFAKFQVIPIRGFRFTHPHTCIHRDKVIAISAPSVVKYLNSQVIKYYINAVTGT